VVRDCRQLASDLAGLLERGDLGIVARELVDVAVMSAVVANSLELVPRTRVITDAHARELEGRLVALDGAIRETLLLPT